MLKFLSSLVVLLTILPALGQNTLVYTSSNKNYKKGASLIDKEKYGASIKFLETFIADNPDDVCAIDALFLVVFAQMQLDQQHASKYLDDFIQEHPGHIKTKIAHYKAGIYDFNKGNYQETIIHLSQVKEHDLGEKQKTNFKFALGYAYFLQKEYDKSLPYFEWLTNTENKYQSAAKYYSGYVYFKQGKFDEAIEVFRALEDSKTYGAVVPFMITNIMYRQGRYQEVVDYGTVVTTGENKVSNKNEIILLVGTAHFELKNYTETIKYLKPYLKAKKGSNSAKYRLSYAAFLMDDFDLASSYFEEFATDNDSIGQAGAYYLGYCYLKQGKKDFALSSFVLASSQDFDRELQAEALLNVGKLYYEAGDFHQAIKVVQRLNTDFSDFVFESPKNEIIADAFLNSNNLDEAINYIEGLKAPNVKINNTYKEVTYLKGVNLFNRKEYKAAISYFTKSYQTKGDYKLNISALFWRAEAYSLLYDWPLAFEDYKYVLNNTNIDQEYHRESLYGRAYTLFNKEIGVQVQDAGLRKRMNEGRYDTSRELFQQYVASVKNKKKDKYFGDAAVRLADCYYINHDYKNALKNYQFAIKEKSRSSAYAQFQLGKVYAYLEKYDASTQSFDVVISRYASSVYVEESMYRKAKNYYATGEYSRSLPYYNVYLKRYGATIRRPAVLLERAVAYLNVSKYSLALEDFDEVLYEYCTDTLYSSQALKGAQESLNLLKKSEEYEKRLEQYFKCGGKGKERLTFEAARDNYRNKNHELAIKQFERFVREHPESVFGYEVNYYLGMSYYDYGDKYKAKGYLREVVASHQKFHYEEALIILSGIYLEMEQWEEANKVNELLLSLSKTENKQLIILLELIQGYYNLINYDMASKYIEQVLTSEVHLIYAVNKARLYKGRIAFEQKRYDDALDEFVLLSNNSKNHYGAEANYMVGKVQYEKKEYLEALETLKNLLVTRQDYLYWYGEGYILASQCYIALGEEFQGKAYLRDVIENFPEESVVNHAKKLLNELETVNEGNDEK